MSTPHKLHIKIGQVEFNAEGTESTVNEQFKRFLEVVSAVGLNLPDPSRSTSPPSPPIVGDAVDNGNKGGQQLPAPSDIDRGTLDRLFAVDPNGVVSLKLLPKTDNRNTDALVMILYGFRVLKQQHDVPASSLVAAAKQSGVNIDRVDRTLAVRDDLFQKGGSRKGSRYALNNQGALHAEQLVKQMMS
jgi:hypothetical protein